MLIFSVVIFVCSTLTLWLSKIYSELFPNYVPRPLCLEKWGVMTPPSSYGSAAPACDRQTDRQASCHGIVRGTHTRRAIKNVALVLRMKMSEDTWWDTESYSKKRHTRVRANVMIQSDSLGVAVSCSLHFQWEQELKYRKQVARRNYMTLKGQKRQTGSSMVTWHKRHWRQSIGRRQLCGQ